MSAPVEYCYSTDDECFNGTESTRHFAAVMAATEVSGDLPEGEDTIVTTAVAVPVHVSSFVRVDAAERLVEDMQEQADEEYGDYSTRFAPTGVALAALQQKIEATVMQWAREHEVEPGFYRTEDTQEHEVRRGVGDDGDTIYLDGEALT